eukprot:gene34607-biopygen34344
MASRFSSRLRDARRRLELAQQRQREQFDRRHTNRAYAVGDLVWMEARHLTERRMDRQLYRKLAIGSGGWHEPLAMVHDVFAQHRLKPFVQGAEAFASRRRVPIPDPVMVDGQAEAHVEKILAYRVRKVRGNAMEEWK